jgi:hypothetical protein
LGSRCGRFTMMPKDSRVPRGVLLPSKPRSNHSSLIWHHESFHLETDVRIALPVRRPSFCRRRSYRLHGHPTYVRAKRHDSPDADELQPEFDMAAQILEPGLRNRLKSNLVALPSNECGKCLLDVEGGALGLLAALRKHLSAQR